MTHTLDTDGFGDHTTRHLNSDVALATETVAHLQQLRDGATVVVDTDAGHIDVTLNADGNLEATTYHADERYGRRVITPRMLDAYVARAADGEYPDYQISVEE